jgi:ketosteroid isomerase-like protein
MPTHPGTVRSLAESYWAAEERRDVDAVMEHYHPDASYQDAGGRRQGARDIRDFYAGSVADYPSLRVDILREFAAAEGAALEFHAVLTDPAGRDWVIRGVNVFQVADGRFTSVRSYEDPPAPADG